MASSGQNIGGYSPQTGFIFIFNLIVGAGALTIPHAFANVGLIYGSIALSFLASISYMTATFMLECIAGVNALKKCAREVKADLAEACAKRPNCELSDSDDSEAQTEYVPLMSQDALERTLRSKNSNHTYSFDLSEKTELAEMAELLFNHRGIVAFYACITVYLYGDLAIYSVAVPKSLREIVCPRPSADAVVWKCLNNFNSSDIYRLFVVLFGLLLGPFVFGHVNKTRTLQLVSTLIRHASFGLMIVLAVLGIYHGHGQNVKDVVSYEKPANIAKFCGVCIYSFMCHHSIPGLVAPITDKRRVGVVLASTFMAVLSVYIVLCTSAVFRFSPGDVEDVYTLNFKDNPVQAFRYFLGLFPVFTLSASFPLICITLRENIQYLVLNMSESVPFSAAIAPSSWMCGFLKPNIFALLALLPPLLVAFFTEDVSMLVSFTGAYAGLCIQWVVPTLLVFCLRRRLAIVWDQMHPNKRFDSLVVRSNKNQFASPFAHQAWLYLVLGLSLIIVILITITLGAKY